VKWKFVVEGANCKHANITKGYCENLTSPCSYCQVVHATFGIANRFCRRNMRKNCKLTKGSCLHFFQIVCKNCRVQLINKVKSSIHLNINKVHKIDYENISRISLILLKYYFNTLLFHIIPKVTSPSKLNNKTRRLWIDNAHLNKERNQKTKEMILYKHGSSYIVDTNALMS
jgi:hypothetical protein